MITLLQLRPYTSDGDFDVSSPNHDDRIAAAIEGIVLHATADDGNEAGALSWLRSPKSRVSCHLLVSRAGQVTRLVGDQLRAWHAGLSWWRGTSDVNSITLGIEIANRNDGEPYTDAQYRRVAEIVAHYCRQGLTLDDVVGHEAIAEDRRSDPFGWDWAGFRTMVQDQLRTVDVEVRLGNTYDRRSSERQAAEVVAAHHATGGAQQSGPTVPVAPITPPRQVAPIAPLNKLPPLPAQKQQVAPIPVPRKRVHTLSKPFLCSLWLNGLTVLAAGSVIVGETLDLAFSVGFSVPEAITMWVLFGVGVVNIIIRHKTICGGSQSVHPSPPEATMRIAGRPQHHGKGRPAGSR
jgi:N-acetyl-anhydromuramyl-L-alanine amidase AmpD